MIQGLDNKTTACGVLLISLDNKILAFARKGDTSKLGLPAGKREKDEDLKFCARRELLEETGVDLDLSNITEIFYYIPDDKQKENKEEYCATFVVRSDLNLDKFILGEANKDEFGTPEGKAIWVTPLEFIESANSAFLDYNTNLLRFAKLLL
jgi:8-oxo-dGTP pyrophosphatase MutT (NUDIX family)